MESTGSAWNTSTGWPNRPSTNWGWCWRTGRVDRFLPSMTASAWKLRATGTACGWASTAATQGTRCRGTTTRLSPLWIETRTATQVWPPHLLPLGHLPFDLWYLAFDLWLLTVLILSAGNCAHYQKGGWWYHMCAHSNLNGVWYRGGHYRSRYQDGVYWAEFHGGAYSLKRVSMMIKPT